MRLFRRLEVQALATGIVKALTEIKAGKRRRPRTSEELGVVCDALTVARATLRRMMDRKIIDENGLSEKRARR